MGMDADERLRARREAFATTLRNATDRVSPADFAQVALGRQRQEGSVPAALLFQYARTDLSALLFVRAEHSHETVVAVVGCCTESAADGTGRRPVRFAIPEELSTPIGRCNRFLRRSRSICLRRSRYWKSRCWLFQV